MPAAKRNTIPTPKGYTVRRFRVDYVRESDPARVTITNKTDVESFARQYLHDLPVERVIVLALDAGNRITGYHVSEGTPNQCAIYPREVFAFLLSCGAVSFIVAHNHPGDTTAASRADWLITEKLNQAAKVLDIRLLDHLIITNNRAESLRESPRWPH